MKNVIAKNDQDWSNRVRARDNYICRAMFPNCQRNGIDTHHIFGRNHKRLRFDVRNGLSVCRLCHIFIENKPLCNMQAVKMIMGDIAFNELVSVFESEYNYKINIK